jgi:hypothetical protein
MIGQRSLTFKNLQDEVLSLMGFAGDSGSMRDLVKERIRANHDQKVVGGDYTFMVFPYPATLTLTAGVRSYALHQAFRAPIYFRSRTTGEDLIEKPSDMLLDNGDISDTAQGNAGDFQLRGVLTIQSQSLEDGTVTVTAADDPAKTITIAGENTSGVVVEETVTVGTASSQTFAAGRIYSVRKNGEDWVGTVTVTSTPDATVIISLAAAEYGKEFRHFYLLSSPEQAEVIEYSFFRFGARLEEDEDIPSIPTPFSRLLVYESLLDLQGYARWTGNEVQRFTELKMETQFALDSTYQEGQSNGASGSYIHFIPR